MKYGAWIKVDDEDQLLGHVEASEPAEAREKLSKKFPGQKFQVHGWGMDDEKYLKKESAVRITASQLRRIIKEEVELALRRRI